MLRGSYWGTRPKEDELIARPIVVISAHRTDELAGMHMRAPPPVLAASG
jgi:hypothetical protein